MSASDDYVDDDSSSDSLGKPAHAFEEEEEDIFSSSSSLGLNGKNTWWRNVVARARRKVGLHDLRNGFDRALLGERQVKRKTNWWNCCIFGGISGMTVLAFLLFINLTLGVATYIWSPKTDHVFDDWGKPGTGTEDLAWYPTDFLRDVTPIPCHSHNDYWRRVPLFDALRAGCTGVEADVWLFDDDLYVGHNTASLTRNRTFTSLYIDPIVKILEHQNPSTDFFNSTNHGVFDTDPGKSLTLLVDVKTGGAETWPWVLQQLEPLREKGWLSYMEDGKVYERAITVVGTGNTPFDVLTANETYRDAFFDAPLDQMFEARHSSEAESDEDLEHESDSSPPAPANVGQGLSGVKPTDSFTPQNSYYASVSFPQAVGRMWRSRLSDRQMRIIRGQVRGAHRRGLKARYWDLPAWPLGLRNHVWDVLVEEGVDVLNVDDLRSASRKVW